MYNIVGALFTNEKEAREAMAALSENPQINGTTIYQISLVKRVEGVLKLCDNFTSPYLKSTDTVKGGIVGGHRSAAGRRGRCPGGESRGPGQQG